LKLDIWFSADPGAAEARPAAGARMKKRLQRSNRCGTAMPASRANEKAR
jgi:hypothetical protein